MDLFKKRPRLRRCEICEALFEIDDADAQQTLNQWRCDSCNAKEGSGLEPGRPVAIRLTGIARVRGSGRVKF